MEKARLTMYENIQKLRWEIIEGYTEQKGDIKKSVYLYKLFKKKEEVGRLMVVGNSVLGSFYISFKSRDDSILDVNKNFIYDTWVRLPNYGSVFIPF